MFDNIMKFFKKNKKEEKNMTNSKEAAKERLHLVLMQDRANVSADFLELMKQEIIEVIKKYIDVDEGAIDVRLTNKENNDGTNGAPALYANIPILNIKNEARKVDVKNTDKNQDNKEKKEVNDETIITGKHGEQEKTSKDENEKIDIINTLEDKEEIKDEAKTENENIVNDGNKQVGKVTLQELEAIEEELEIINNIDVKEESATEKDTNSKLKNNRLNGIIDNKDIIKRLN